MFHNMIVVHCMWYYTATVKLPKSIVCCVHYVVFNCIAILSYRNNFNVLLVYYCVLDVEAVASEFHAFEFFVWIYLGRKKVVSVVMSWCYLLEITWGYEPDTWGVLLGVPVALVRGLYVGVSATLPWWQDGGYPGNNVAFGSLEKPSGRNRPYHAGWRMKK